VWRQVPERTAFEHLADELAPRPSFPASTSGGLLPDPRHHCPHRSPTDRARAPTGSRQKGKASFSPVIKKGFYFRRPAHDLAETASAVPPRCAAAPLDAWAADAEGGPPRCPGARTSRRHRGPAVSPPRPRISPAKRLGLLAGSRVPGPPAIRYTGPAETPARHRDSLSDEYLPTTGPRHPARFASPLLAQPTSGECRLKIGDRSMSSAASGNDRGAQQLSLPRCRGAEVARPPTPPTVSCAALHQCGGATAPPTILHHPLPAGTPRHRRGVLPYLRDPAAS